MPSHHIFARSCKFLYVKQFRKCDSNHPPIQFFSPVEIQYRKIYSPAIAYAFFCFGFVSFFVASTKNKRNKGEGDKNLKQYNLQIFIPTKRDCAKTQSLYVKNPKKIRFFLGNKLFHDSNIKFIQIKLKRAI